MLCSPISFLFVCFSPNFNSAENCKQVSLTGATVPMERQATVHGVPESDTTEQAHNIYLNQKIILINTLARELEN